jgi:APA family basic amino acid/polyamine antiporter
VTGDLRRQLGLLDATAINLGTMIGSGIFIVPASIALALPATGPMLAVWVAGGLVSLLGALCLAELGGAYPASGGMFVYLREAFGPAWGYLYGWTTAIVINPASIAAIAVGFATYTGFFVPLSPAGVKAVAIGSIVLLTALNAAGVRAGAATQNAFTLLKVALLVGLVASLVVFPGGRPANLLPLWGADGHPLAAFGVATVAVLWAYDGWIEVTYVGGEVRDPGRVVPRSIVLATVLAIALYTLVSLAFLYVLSPAGAARSALPASDAARVTQGAVGAGLVALAIMISTLGANNGIIFTSARIPYAMARGGLFLPSVGRLHPRFGTPVVSLVHQGLVAAALAVSGTYDQLFTYVVFASWVFYAFGAAALLRLRRTAPHLERPYRAWGYPATPLVFIAFALYLVGTTIVQAPRDSAVGIGLIVIGLLPYGYWGRRRRHATAPAAGDRA